MDFLHVLVEVLVGDHVRDRVDELLGRPLAPHDLPDRADEHPAPHAVRRQQEMPHDVEGDLGHIPIEPAGGLLLACPSLLERPESLDHPRPVVVVPVQRPDEPVVAALHLIHRHELRGEVEVGSSVPEHRRRVVREETSFLLEPGVQRRLLDRGQNPAGREGDPGFHEEVELLLEDPMVVVIEADDHPGDDHQVVGLDQPDAVEQRPVSVLALLGLHETVDARRLDPHEDAGEVRLPQELQQLRPLRHGDGHLGGELNGIVVLSAPRPRSPPGAAPRTSGSR